MLKKGIKFIRSNSSVGITTRRWLAGFKMRRKWTKTHVDHIQLQLWLVISSVTDGGFEYSTQKISSSKNRAARALPFDKPFCRIFFWRKMIANLLDNFLQSWRFIHSPNKTLLPFAISLCESTFTSGCPSHPHHHMCLSLSSLLQWCEITAYFVVQCNKIFLTQDCYTDSGRQKRSKDGNLKLSELYTE